MELYVTDLDGTLLNYAAKLKSRAAIMLNRAIDSGVNFTFATARRHSSALPTMKDVRLNLPIVTLNGVVIAHPDGTPLIINYIDKNVVEQLRSFFLSQRETPIVYHKVGEELLVGYDTRDMTCTKQFVSARKDDPLLRPHDNDDDLYGGDIYYFTLIAPRTNLHEIREFLDSVECNYVIYPDIYLDQYLVEICKKGVNKASGIRFVQDYIHADKLITFGDNLNDLPMFGIADACYAVANAENELKQRATGVIPSNEEMGVPRFIERQWVTLRRHEAKNSICIEPNAAKFENCIRSYIHNHTNIGTLNEKAIHAVLKAYFSEEGDSEAKIGAYYADVVGENGIFEIQSGSFGKLNAKLDVFLRAAHVTLVYPFERIVHNVVIDEQTVAIVKQTKSYKYDRSRFFLELYRIRGLLTDPNLTVCIAELEVMITKFVDSKGKLQRKKEKQPLKLLREIYLQKPDDYAFFLPENLPVTFTKKDLMKLKPQKQKCDTSLLIEILEYMSVVHKVGKTGNSFTYSTTAPSVLRLC
jgi:Cof subfamily protein (haloacid dehalogenase superfamily)